MRLAKSVFLSFLGFVVVSALPAAAGPQAGTGGTVVLISADAEWKVVKALYPQAKCGRSPWGEFFPVRLETGPQARNVLFVQGGWGKVAAAGSTQYCIDRWKPELLVNLGTCGGFEGDINRFEIILVDRTVVYDIVEAMGDSSQAIAERETVLDLHWLRENLPAPVRRTLLVSGDRDIVPSEIPVLRRKYHAVAADWESGAIAYTCAKNGQKVLILRGVSDLVSPATGGEAYGNPQVFADGARVVMKELVRQLPMWIEKAR